MQQGLDDDDNGHSEWLLWGSSKSWYNSIYINIRFRIIHQGSCIHVGKDSTYNKVNIVGPDNKNPKLYSTNRAVSKYYT